MTHARHAAGGVAAALALLLASAGAHAAAYMKLGDIKGEAAAAGGGGGGSGGQIEVQSFSWGASNPTSVGSAGMGAGRASAAPPPGAGTVHVTAPGARCAKGKHFPTATLRQDDRVYELSDVTVSVCGVHGDPHVMELSYGKVSVQDLSIGSPPRKGGSAR
jgi:type VI protein secretion system component Hcp